MNWKYIVIAFGKDSPFPESSQASLSPLSWDFAVYYSKNLAKLVQQESPYPQPTLIPDQIPHPSAPPADIQSTWTVFNKNSLLTLDVSSD